MGRKFTQKLLIIISLSFYQIIIGQNQKIDSLSKQSFEIFEKYFSKSYVDSINDVIYGNALLLKAKTHTDSIKMANAYYYLSDASPIKKSLLYCDSIISLTKNLNKHSIYPALGFLQKGIMYYNSGKYDKALDSYLTSLKHAERSNNKLYILTIKSNIGHLKSRIGKEKEALEIFKEYILYLNENKLENKEFYLIRGLYSLADSYKNNKKNDSAKLYINIGIEKSINAKDSLMQAYYTYLSGVNFFYLKKYKESIDNLLRSKNIFYDENLNTTTNLYLGKSYYAIEKKDNAIEYFKEVDSFLQKTKNITPELIEIYPPLIEYKKDSNDLQGQLNYVNRLLKFDSILNKNDKYLSENIIRKYEIPSLIFTREKIIEGLKDKNTISQKYIFTLILIAFLLLISTIYFIKRSTSNKKKFNLILEEVNSTKNNKKPLNDRIKITTTTGIPEELVKEVLLKLETFENKNKFIKNYTLSSLAKELKTNSNYLSKIINATKNCNFSNYINDLRINFAKDKLTNDKTFRSYTIKAIANDVGFNTAQSFSNAFYRKTGLYPSYFIKQLEKRNNT